MQSVPRSEGRTQQQRELTRDELVARFAVLVAKPGTNALVITADNKGGGWIPLRIATQKRVAFAVEVADDVFALDDDARAPAGSFDRLVTELRDARLVPVVVASGRHDHHHVFVRCRERERWVTRAKALGFRGDAFRIESALIRPPLSPHRSGLPVALLDPPDPLDALVALAPLRKGRRLSRAM